MRLSNGFVPYTPCIYDSSRQSLGRLKGDWLRATAPEAGGVQAYIKLSRHREILPIEGVTGRDIIFRAVSNSFSLL
jgi:hypothetical protein